jgi:hypothetical protein
MKVLLIGILTLGSISVFGVGGTTGTGNNAHVCTLENGETCYDPDAMMPGGATLCDSFTPPSCTLGSVSGSSGGIGRVAPARLAPVKKNNNNNNKAVRRLQGR